MPQEIAKMLVADGTMFLRRQMDNGEFRDSIVGVDKSSYIRTSMPASAKGAWQNSHYHGMLADVSTDIEDPARPGVRESITVIQGWLGGVELLPSGAKIVKVYKKNQTFFTIPGIAHNFYQASGTVTHCCKYGDEVGNPDEQRKGADWWPAPADFDAWCKSLTEDDIFRLAKLSARLPSSRI